MLLLGVSYRQDVADTRYSPSEEFYKKAVDSGSSVLIYDPMVRHWDELNLSTLDKMPSLDDIDAVVFAVPHSEFKNLDFTSWAGESRPIIYDAFGIFDAEKRKEIRDLGFVLESLGRGYGL